MLAQNKEGQIKESLAVADYLAKRVVPRLLRVSNYFAFLDGTRFCSQTVEDSILAHLLVNHEPGVYVDFGVFHPIRFSNAYYFIKEAGRVLASTQRTAGLTCLTNCGLKSVDVKGMELDVFESHDWIRFPPRVVAAEWLEPLSLKDAISIALNHFLDQRKYELICKTP